MADSAYLEKLTKQLADEGRLIEAGWVSLRLQAIPLNAPPVQLEEMHKAYMAGAQHLYASLFDMLDPCSDITEDDMRRMALVQKEMDDYAARLMADLKTEGNG